MSEASGSQTSQTGQTGQTGPPAASPPRPPAMSTRGAPGPAPAGCLDALLGPPIVWWHTVVIVLLTVAADICLYGHPGGTGGAVLILVTVIGLLCAVPAATWRQASPLLIAAAVLVALRLIWDSWWLLNVVAVLTVAAFALKLRRPDWRVTELVWTVPATALLAPFRLLRHVAMRGGPSEQAGRGIHRRLPMRVVLVPLIVAGLFVLIFIAANPVVERIADRVSRQLSEWLRDFVDLFTAERMFTWLCWLVVFAGLVMPAVKSWLADYLAKRPEHLAAADEPEANREDFTTALATLIAVNAVFLAFNALDSVYLYFKARLPEAISYSTYSRRGCAWLTFALLVSTVTLGAVFRRRMNFHPRAATLRAWSYVWGAQNLWLALGAIRRLHMYVDYNGLTRSRLVGLYGILLVVVGLVLMFWKVRRARNFLWLVRRDALAFCIALLVLALTPVDYVCWRYNVATILGGNSRPLVLLHAPTMTPIRPEALPLLIPLLDYSNPEDRAEEKMVREGVAALLGRNYRWLEENPQAYWTEWSVARAWALARLRAVSDRLPRSVPGAREPARDAPEERLRGYTRQWF